MIPHQPRILVVDDEVLVAFDLTRRLTRLGYQVVGTAATGAEALYLATTARPDVVLMDITLRGAMDGIDAAQAIRRHTPMPIVYLSANVDASTRARIHASGAAGYLHKPVDIQVLQQTLAQVLASTRSAPP